MQGWIRALAPAVVALALLAGGCTTLPAAPPATPAGGIDIPIEYYRLDNGLKVVLSHSPAAPTVTAGVYYRIGFRTEPRERTGFAHLFEHLMFQGSENLGKMEFIRLIEGNGGALNGSTRFDFTNYYQVVPANTLETILWAEADRMRTLAITQENLTNQQDVVKNEVRVNVLNRPYGGFPWLQMPQMANENWFNAHNFYGDLDHIDAATLDEARAFFDAYYAPNNAVLVVAGDFDAVSARAWILKYFGPVSARPQPARPDVAEPLQQAEKRRTHVDPLAPRPALALAWQVPPRNTPEHYAFGLIDEMLLQGEDSELWQRLVQQRGWSSSVSGGINLLGNMFNYDGPMLWTLSLVHDSGADPAAIVADIDEVIGRLQQSPPDAADMARALTKIRAWLYDLAGSSTRFGLVDLLANFALFDDDPGRINRLEQDFRAVTPELVQRVARDYLQPARRTVLMLQADRPEVRP